MWLKLAVIAAIYIGFASGASLATAEARLTNCTVADGFQALSCLMRLSDFGTKIDELDMEDKSQIAEFKDSCDSLSNCFASLNCDAPDPAAKKAIVSIRNYCDAVIYVANDFAECSEKLELKNSTCFDDWTPFPEEIDLVTDPKKKEEINQEACENFFGKDNCLEKEIKEICGDQDWYGFRDHFISISNLVLKCDFSHML